MIRYQVVDGHVEFGMQHTLLLDEKQFAARRHRLAIIETRKDKSVVAKPIESVQFKAGEVIGLEGNVPRNMESRLSRVPEKGARSADVAA